MIPENIEGIVTVSLESVQTWTVGEFRFFKKDVDYIGIKR